MDNKGPFVKAHLHRNYVGAKPTISLLQIKVSLIKGTFLSGLPPMLHKVFTSN